jgi:hypothetical protein
MDRHITSILTVPFLLVAIGLGLLVAWASTGGSFSGPEPTVTATTTATPTPTATPTATPTNTPTATPTATPEPVIYRVTYYGIRFQGGPLGCGTDIYGRFDRHDPTTVASGDGGPPCGTHLLLCSEAACQDVVVKDACGGCGPYRLDLSRAAWEVLGRPTHVEASLIQEPAQAPAAAPRAGNLDALPVPPGTSVNSSGCASDGFCTWYNFYWSPTHEVVMQGEEPWVRVVHERCHAHQHWSINGGDPTREDLSAWYGTEEAASFGAAATGWPYPYAFTTANNLLEDFAEACALWYTDPVALQDISPSRLDWMAANLP